MPKQAIKIVVAAAVDAEDRQRALNEVCRRVLQGFYGRKITPYLMVAAEATLRAALNDAVAAGTYVLPDGLALDRVELGADMRIKVLFKRTDVSIQESPLNVLEPNRQELPAVDKVLSRFDAVAAEITDNDD